MSDVTRRTVFYDMADGYVRFHDWAIVNTTLGVMAEPFIVLPFGVGRIAKGGDRPNIDNTDPCRLITELKQESMDGTIIMASFGNTAPIHGGIQYPRAGR
jgi:hypothetical protein